MPADYLEAIKTRDLSTEVLEEAVRRVENGDIPTAHLRSALTNQFWGEVLKYKEEISSGKAPKEVYDLRDDAQRNLEALTNKGGDAKICGVTIPAEPY